MSGAAVRSRIVELRRDREAAQRGRDLLEQKHEVLLRELIQRTRIRDEESTRATAAVDRARRLLREAEIELGPLAIDAAALAQPTAVSVSWHGAPLVGVVLPQLRMPPIVFRPLYGTGGTAESLDCAGVAFADALTAVVRLAEAEEAARNVRLGLRKTARRLNALDKVVLPQIERDLRQLRSAIEEEERDEASRTRRSRRRDFRSPPGPTRALGDARMEENAS
jgi:V/A-type H+/Na+-transporting ATPase subunit D